MKAAAFGGAGFDVTQHDALRDSIRAAVGQCSYGSAAAVSMDAVAGALYRNRLRTRGKPCRALRITTW